MGKGARNRNKRLEIFGNSKEAYSSGMMGFCLPDTPDNRDLVRMITGKDPEQFINEDGMLDSLHEEETAISSR